MSSDSCWCRLLPGSYSLHTSCRRSTRKPAHKQVWFATQSSTGVKPGLAQHLLKVGKLMGQGFEAVLKALGGFASVEVEPEDLQNSSSSARGRQVGGDIGAARATYVPQRGNQSAEAEGLGQTCGGWGQPWSASASPPSSEGSGCCSVAVARPRGRRSSLQGQGSRPRMQDIGYGSTST